MRDTAAPARVVPRPGAVLRDLTGEIVVLVLEANGADGRLMCDGVPMIAGRPVPCGDSPTSSARASTLLFGRRYADRLRRIEIRCLRGGNARLSFAGLPLTAIDLATHLPALKNREPSWSRTPQGDPEQCP
jgi:hypothetical protein